MLTKQIYQKINISFQDILKKVRERKFESQNVYILNQRFAREFLAFDSLNIVIVIQKNKTCHLINQL